MKKKNIILPLIAAITLILILFVNAAEVSEPPDIISAVEPVNNTQTGIDYDSGLIITGKVNGEYDSGYSINLTKETFTVPEGYKIAAYSVDGGTRWTVVGSKPFDNASLSALFSSDVTLAFTDKYDSNRKPTADATVVKFAKIKKRPRFTNTYVVNYSIGEDSSGLTAGTWLLTAKNGKESIKEGIEVAAANSAGKAPDSKGYGKFYGTNGSANGIEIAEMPSNGKAVKTSYFIRKGATANSDGTYTAASEAAKITVEGQAKNSAYSVDKTRKIINYPANTYIYRYDYAAPELKKAKGTLDISNYSGDVYLWSAASGTAPASAMQKTTITLSGNDISAATETVVTFSESSAANPSAQIAPSSAEARTSSGEENNIGLFVVGSVPVTNVIINPQNLDLILGKTNTGILTATVLPDDPETNKNVTWYSSNTSVATVANGVVTAVGAGTTTIKVTTVDGDFSDICTVTVSIPVTGVTLSQNSFTLSGIGKTQQLTATVQPNNASNNQVVWSTSDDSIASVSNNGLVTAVGAGTVTVTATTNDGGFTATCTVTVITVPVITSPDNNDLILNGVVGRTFTYSSLQAKGGGTITWSAAGLPEGISINANTGVISGTPVYDNNGNLYSVSVTASNSLGTSAQRTIKIQIAFACTVTFSSVTEGSFPPDGLVTAKVDDVDSITSGAHVAFGRSVVFYANPPDGYQVSKWEASYTNNGSTIPMPEVSGKGNRVQLLVPTAAEHTSIAVKVTFEIMPTYKITFEMLRINSRDVGTITASPQVGNPVTASVSSITGIRADRYVIFKANRDDGYDMVEWRVDNLVIGSNLKPIPATTADETAGVFDLAKYNKRIEDVTLYPRFRGDSYTFQLDRGENGIIQYKETVAVTVKVEPRPSVILTTVLPSGTVGVPYKEFFEIDSYKKNTTRWEVLNVDQNEVATITDSAIREKINNNDVVKDKANFPVPGLWLEPDAAKNGEISGTPTKSGTYVFIVVATDWSGTTHTKKITITIYDRFEIKCSVVPETLPNGTISGTYSGGTINSTSLARLDLFTWVNEGENVVFTANPGIGYRVKEWIVLVPDSNPENVVTVGGTDIKGYKKDNGINYLRPQADNIYTLTNLKSNAIVTVEFEPIDNSYSVNFKTDGNGTLEVYEVTSGGRRRLNSGDYAVEGCTIEFTAKSEQGYSIKDWRNITSAVWVTNTTWYDAVSTGVTIIKNGSETHSVTNLKADVYIGVTFKLSTPVTDLHLNKYSTSISEGGNETLIATILPNSASQRVTWKIANAKDAEGKAIDLDSDKDGNALAAGKFRVAKVVNGKVTVEQDPDLIGATFDVIVTSVAPTDATGTKYATATCTVKVTAYVPVTGISVDKTLNLLKGNSETLKAVFTPADASNKDVLWTSDNPSVATVNKDTGEVTAVSLGTARITVTTLANYRESGTWSATCTVTVRGPTYGIVLDPSVNKTFGTLPPTGAGDQQPHSVVVSNPDDEFHTKQPTGTIQIKLTGSTDDFILSKTSIESINVGGSDSFTITPATGKTLSGGLHRVTVTVSGDNGISKSFNAEFTVDVSLAPKAPVITTASLPNGMIDTLYSHTLEATGALPITWKVVSGSLPAGLNLNSASGVISGKSSVKVSATKITIEASNSVGKDTQDFYITVDAPITVTGVTLDKSATVAVGQTITLTATVNPYNATDKNVLWNSSDSSVARVDSNGAVTGVKAGTADITVTTANGGKTATCKVTVTTEAAAAGRTEVTGLTLNKTTLTISVGGSGVITPIIAPSNASETSVTWKTTNPNVAVPDQYGKIYGISEGTAIITATTKDGNKAATCMVTVTQFPVTGVTLNKAVTTLAVGDTDTLTANIAPSNAGNKSVTWSSNNITVAMVDQNGKITAKAPGTALVSVMTADGNKTATCTVTVTAISSTGISMKSSATIAVGSSETLVVTFTPTNASNKNLTWTSDNTNVATVDSSGKVTAKAAGNAAVTAKTSDGKTAICSVTVNNIAVTGITMKNSTTIGVGSSEILTVTTAPTNATNKTITWSSSNTSVATVDANGKVNGISSGVATVTASTADGNKTAVCIVNVEVGYTITLGQSANGTATSSHVKATAGTRVTLTELPIDGYYLVGWQISPAEVAISGNSFTMPAANVIVTPVFKQILTLSSYINPDNIDTRNPSYTLSFTGNQLLNGSAGVCLPGSVLANISSKNSEFIIEIATPYGTYQIPANLASVIPELNDILSKNNLKISDIGFNIIISDKAGDKAIANALANSMPKSKLIGSPVDFKIEIVKMTNGKPGSVIGKAGDNLTQRIARLIPMPQNVKTMPESWGAFRYNATADKFEFVPHTTRIINDTLYVIINSASNSVYMVAENPVSFNDVPSNEWYSGYIYKAASKRLVQGVGNGLYQPERNVTRAEFVQMMVTALQLPKAKSGTKTYGDATGDWYYDAIMRAKSAGLLDKFTGDRFNPNQAITREEIAVIMVAAIRYEKFTVLGNAVNLAGVFTDYNNFNKEFASDVEIVYRLNIMQGMGGGIFSPKGTTTRAQASTVLIRLLENLTLID